MPYALTTWPLNRGKANIWRVSSETRYRYDGMRVIQERNASNVPQVSYTRGTDLSGAVEGAGGIGGLLGAQPRVSDRERQLDEPQLLSRGRQRQRDVHAQQRAEPGGGVCV